MGLSDQQSAILPTQHEAHGLVILHAVDVYSEADGLGPGQVTARGIGGITNHGAISTGSGKEIIRLFPSLMKQKYHSGKTPK